MYSLVKANNKVYPIMMMALCHLIQNNVLFYLKPHMGTVYILYNCIDFRGLLYLHKDVRHVENYDR